MFPLFDDETQPNKALIMNRQLRQKDNCAAKPMNGNLSTAQRPPDTIWMVGWLDSRPDIHFCSKTVLLTHLNNILLCCVFETWIHVWI